MALDLLTNTGMQEYDELRVRGVRSHGFGQLAKMAMLDEDLSIESKGILAYFASYTGAGSNVAFPGRNRIIADLGINKDTFYKHFNLLKEQGYISVIQVRGNSSGYHSHNVYTIEDYPPKYATIPTGKISDAKRSSLELIACLKDINAGGYGNIPKLVMTDNCLSIQAKALYAYLCVFAGENAIATPNKNVAISHLKISPNSYSKYVKELEWKGYITRSQINEDGRFGTFVYSLNKIRNTTSAEMKTIAPDTKIPDTKIPDTKIPDTKIPDTKISDTKIPDTEISGTSISDTNNTNPSSKTINNKTKTKQAAACARADTANAVVELKAEFDQFITAYPPMPFNEEEAWREFKRSRIPIEDLINALELWKESSQWKEGYIPSPGKFFRNGYCSTKPRLAEIIDNESNPPPLPATVCKHSASSAQQAPP